MSPSELSPLAAHLVELLGRRTAQALCRVGGQVYVPSRHNPNCRLARMIGTGNTAKLMQFYAGRHLDLPKLAAVDRAKRNAEIHRMAAEGVPRPEIALRHGLTVRMVRRILSSVPVPE